MQALVNRFHRKAKGYAQKVSDKTTFLRWSIFVKGNLTSHHNKNYKPYNFIFQLTDAEDGDED